MGRNLFAPQGEQQAAPADQPRKGRNLFAPQPAAADDFSQKTAGMTREQILEEYRKAEINSPYYNHLVKLIEQPQAGETPEQAAVRAGGVAPKGAPSQLLSGFGGAADTLSFGLADEIGAGAAALSGGDYDQALEQQRRFRAALEEENPGSYLTGQIAGIVPQIGATVGISAPLTAGGRLAANTAAGAAQSGAYGFASGEGVGGRLAEGAEGAAWGAGLGMLPSAVEGIYKGGKALINRGVKNVQKITNPNAAAEKDLVDRMVGDWKTQAKLDKRAIDRGQPPTQRRFLTADDVVDAEGAGQRVMVSDIGGDATRRRLDAAAVASPDAANLMRGAAAQRQVNQGERVTDVVSDAFGDLNPKTIRDELLERARRENEAAYKLAEDNPNAAHLWNPVLQRALSTSAGKRALTNAIKKSRDKALRNGEEIIEPIFEEGPDGLMAWTGKFRKPTGEIADDIEGLGLNLRFWDSVKRSMQDDIDELQRAGRKDEAADIIGIKREMVDNLDLNVGEYKNARTTARDFFGMEDAHEAGASYFKNMNAFDIAEARAALQAMKPAERELFARGYAAELVTRISRMGQAEDVNKLFKSPQARMKMRDALGDRVADQMEAYTHREMVQSLLGKHIGGNSKTAEREWAMEGLKQGAGWAAAGGAGYYTTGDWTGMLAGLALRGGYRATQRKVIDRYAKALAELATSEDPDTIARILAKVSKDSGYMDFSRSVANGLGAGGQAAGRIEPRMPFAKGGLVKKGVKELLNYITDEGAEKAAKKAPTVDISDMPRIFDLSDLEAVPDVEQKMIPRYNPKRGVSARMQDLIDNPNVQRGLSETIERGVQIGGKRWYNNEPLRQRFKYELGEEEGERAFRQFMDYVAATSPRSKVPENARNASYYYTQARKGSVPEVGSKNPQPYGHMAQRLHQMNANRVFGEGWDPINNPKPASFVENLIGNQVPGTMDTHATRLPGILSEDPRWLGTQLQIKDPITKETINLNPRKLYQSGEISIEDALQRPAMWDPQPNDNEYAALEQLYANLSREQGLTTAQGQASAWAAGADKTGLGSVGSDPFLKVLEDRVLMTAKKLGMDPQEVLSRMIHGELPLLRDGGRVTSALAAAASPAP